MVREVRELTVELSEYGDAGPKGVPMAEKIAGLWGWYERRPRAIKWCFAAALAVFGFAFGFATAALPVSVPRTGLLASEVVLGILVCVIVLDAVKPYGRIRFVCAFIAAIGFFFLVKLTLSNYAAQDAAAALTAVQAAEQTNAGQLAYVEGSLMKATTIPNQSRTVIYLPQDFDVSRQINNVLPISFENPWASSPVAARITLRNDGSKPWIYYLLSITVHYESKPALPPNGDWHGIPHTDEMLVLTNCRTDGFLCESPPLEPGGKLTVTVFNLSGAIAALEIPGYIAVRFPDSKALTTAEVDVGGGNIVRSARTIVLEPNREGQGTFVR